jgi:cell division protein FtsQ
VNAKKTIRKILFIAFWLCIGGGMFTLLLAAISKKNKGLCKGYTISIKGAKNNLFIDMKDVEQLLIKTCGGNIKDRPVASINLHQLEQVLDQNVWISNAELYFDSRDELHVIVSEKEPIARIFTTAGASYYIDSMGNKLPLSNKLSARLPVFTNFPDKKSLNAKDSVLLKDVRTSAGFILHDPFWMSQVAQVDITPAENFEMVPVIGNHIVRLGNGDNISEKFRRLMIFYQQVLSKTGFNKYKVIDVAYSGQVVVSRYNADEKIDSVQLRKNVEKLLQSSRDAQNDTLTKTPIPVTAKYQIPLDSAEAQQGESTNKPGEHNNPNLMKPFLEKPADVRTGNPKPVHPKPDLMKQPRAVMPKKPAGNENNN